MANGPADSYKKGKDRVELNRAVKLRFGKFQDFLTEIASNISPGGMFVSSNDPRPPGEQFEFECSLADGFPLVSGRAQVVWVRRISMSAEEPCGMGVRFLELMDDSEELIRRIVEKRVKAGETTFDLERERDQSSSGVDEAATNPGLSAEILAATESPIEEANVSAPPAELSPDLVLSGPLAPPAGEPLGFEPELPELPELAEPAEPAARPEEEKQPSRQPRPPASPEPSVTAKPPAASWPPPEASSTTEAAQTRPIPEATEALAGPKPVRAGPPSRESTAPLPPFPDPAARVARVGTAQNRLGVRRLLELLLLSLVVGAGVVLLLNQFWVGPRIEGLENRLDELSGSSRVGSPSGAGLGTGVAEAESSGRERAMEQVREDDPGAAAAPAPAAVSGVRAAASKAPPLELVREVIRGWARAWSERRVEEYLSYYSVDFVPASGATRADWERRRRDRLLSPGSIRVTVVSLNMQDVTPTEMRVTFTQSYRSDTYRDRVRKTFRMVWETGAWKIAEETVVRQLPW